jgi:hypothetical protein
MTTYHKKLSAAMTMVMAVSMVMVMVAMRMCSVWSSVVLSGAMHLA